MKYKIKQIREAKGISQETLSERSKVSRATISKIESDQEVEVKMSTLEALASALECKISDFLSA